MVLTTAISNARIMGSSREDTQDEKSYTSTVYGSRWAAEDIPRLDLPEEEMPAAVAYKLIKDELALDGNPVLNLASFVTTYMDPEADRLMMENASKNFIDYEEYPQTCEIHSRCVNIIARLFHAPLDDINAEAIGCSTVGSSEAIILSCLALKRRWQIWYQENKGDVRDARPNLVMGANVQVCWEKAVKYLEIEPRYVYCTKDRYVISPEEAVVLVDEHTIGIVAILGSTYTGHYEDVKGINDLLVDINRTHGWQVVIHVDAASGGFVAPFVNPTLEWDFKVPLVASINTSGHKYGLTYPGIGWNIWRSPEYLPADLIFNINYLGSEQASFTLNFSKSASNVIAQYYTLIRLGRQGYTSIMKNLVGTADHLASCLERSGHFIILSEGGGRALPVVAFRLRPQAEGESLREYDEYDVARCLRDRGWIVPAYTMAPKAETLKLMRIVVREDLSRGRCDILIRDMMRAISLLEGGQRVLAESRSRKQVHETHQKKSSWDFVYQFAHRLTMGGVVKDGSMEKKVNGIC